MKFKKFLIKYLSLSDYETFHWGAASSLQDKLFRNMKKIFVVEVKLETWHTFAASTINSESDECKYL